MSPCVSGRWALRTGLGEGQFGLCRIGPLAGHRRLFRWFSPHQLDAHLVPPGTFGPVKHSSARQDRCFRVAFQRRCHADAQGEGDLFAAECDPRCLFGRAGADGFGPACSHVQSGVGQEHGKFSRHRTAPPCRPRGPTPSANCPASSGCRRRPDARGRR